MIAWLRVSISRPRAPQLHPPLLVLRHADEAPPETRHEVDRVGSHLLRRDGQVSLVLAVLVVDHDDKAPPGDVADGVLDRGERRPVPAVPAPAHCGPSFPVNPCRARSSRVTAGAGP